MEACDAIYYPMKNKKSNTALKRRKRRRLGAFIFVVVLLALAVVAVRIYNMNEPSRDAELLTLVNPWNTIPDGYEPQLCTLSDGQQIDRRCYDDLMRMLDDCRAAGNSPYICSAYRTWDKQQALFDNKIQRLENEGMDADTAYNINADTAAAKLAEALKAEKLILLTDVRGLLRDPHDEDTLIHVLHTYEVPELVAQGVISGGMIPKMQCCVDAIAGGVERVHILDGRIPHSILIELLSDEGIGTMLKKEED